MMTRRLTTCVAAALALTASAWAQGITLPNSLLEDPASEYTLACRVSAGAGWAVADELRLFFDVAAADRHAYCRVAGGKAGLYLVAEGKVQAVGEARPFPPPKAWRAALQRREGRVRLIADGRVILDEAWARPGVGRGAIAAGGAVQTADVLLQPYAPPEVRDDFTREGDELGGWEVAAGTWRNTMVPAPRAEAARSANPFCLRATGSPDGLASLGDWFWDTYRVSTSVRLSDAKAAGLCAYVQDAANMLRFRWETGPPDKPRAKQLLLVRQGKATVLAEGAGGCVPDQWYQLAVELEPGKATVLIDRYPVLSATTDAFGQGGVGLLCEGGTAVFDDVVVAPPGARDTDRPRINPTFLADETMAAQQVFLPIGQWRPPEGGVVWNWGEFFDDATVSLPAGALTGEATVVLLRAPSADATGVQGAYAVSLRNQDGTVSAELQGPAGKAASGSCSAAPDEWLEVKVAGNAVTVQAGPKPILSFTDPAPPAGRRIGLGGAVGNLPSLAMVTSSQLLDYAFDSAPTDWFAAKGLWQVTTRWPCQPGWTFFGGTHDENPVLWTKHKYEGDQVLEAFANIQMDGPPPPGYSRPSDVDLALCGDGVDLGSGYAFVVAGWKNTKTAILRRGHIVAETKEVVFVDPTSGNSGFHRHWFRVRAEKLGSRVALSVDGTQVLTYDDPEPLTGGRAGLWSFHNGLMVGRARLWFAGERPGGVVPPLPAPAENPALTPRAAEAPVRDDFEAGTGEWQTFSNPTTVALAQDSTTASGGKSCLRLTNLVSGGSLGVYAVTTPFRATDCPRLGFDYRLPPGLQVNLYLYLNDRWHALQLTAEEPPSGSTTVLGRLEGVQADDRWHHAELDLLTPLQALYPQLKAFTVKYVAFAAPGESYVRCGIGGNGRGATYWVDNFAIGPRP